MNQFASLLEKLVLTPGRNQKIAYLAQYFRETPDPDRGYALAVLTGSLSLPNVKASLLKDIVLQKVDPTLFALSYDYVGDLAETIGLIWPEHKATHLPRISELIIQFKSLDKKALPEYISSLLSSASSNERWAIIKLVTGNLRIGVSARLTKTALAEFSRKPLADIEHVWHGLEAPYYDLFAWLEDKGPQPVVHHHRMFHPMMLSNPIGEEKDFSLLNPADYQAEWKWDGIRVQLSLGENEKRIFSRTGDTINHAFPDLLRTLSGKAVLDGELLVGRNFIPSSFNDLQQRLNRKTVSAKMMADYPPFVRLYDILFDGDEDIRFLPLLGRRQRLEAWLKANPNPNLDLSAIIPFNSWGELASIRQQGSELEGKEGIMLKHKESIYEAGRAKGPWFKWKRDPRLIDAVLMYAQRGHGKRSSFYSDYTFGLWQGNEIVPIGKAYSGFTDEELVQLDRWIRNNTIGRFGPVREVKKELVFEVAFDSAQKSSRHHSGIALRFPRINRIRWDKPAQEADKIETMKSFLSSKA